MDLFLRLKDTTQQQKKVYILQIWRKNKNNKNAVCWAKCADYV